MKFTAEIIKKAHAMTREIKKEYVDVDYRVQFGLCLSYLLEKGGRKMTYAEYKNSNDFSIVSKLLEETFGKGFRIINLK